MSQQVQSIIEAVRNLDLEQRQELTAALAAIEAPRAQVSESRKDLVESVRGKFRYVPTSSESFMNRKREEESREQR